MICKKKKSKNESFLLLWIFKIWQLPLVPYLKLKCFLSSFHNAFLQWMTKCFNQVNTLYRSSEQIRTEYNIQLNWFKGKNFCFVNYRKCFFAIYYYLMIAILIFKWINYVKRTKIFFWTIANLPRTGGVHFTGEISVLSEIRLL